MTTIRNKHTISLHEFLVLARLSVPKSPGPKEITNDVAKLMLTKDSSACAQDRTMQSLLVLHQQGYLISRRGSQRSLTETGARILCTEFGLDCTPSWQEIRDAHLPALALGLTPGSNTAGSALKNGVTISACVLRLHNQTSERASLNDICDTIIIKMLGLGVGPITLNQIRARILLLSGGLATLSEPQVVANAPGKIAKQVAASAIGSSSGQKRSLVEMLSRRWIYAVNETWPHRRQHGHVIPAAAHRELVPQAIVAHEQVYEPPRTSTPPGENAILMAVHEAIPRVGPDGRFGTEKVFVSAIWRRIEQDRRWSNLSLENFKQWLVTANRNQLINLARADLVNSMDSTLVRESEIKVLGATFHFVLDRPMLTPRSEPSAHAR